MADEEKLPVHIEEILKKASQDILKNQNGFCFSMDNYEQPSNEANPYVTAYDNAEIAEYINYDVLGDEDENGFLIQNTDSNQEDLTGDGKVLKILLDPGIGQVVPEDSVVLVHYVGYVANLPEPFDVTYLQGRKPKRFTLGHGELLMGLEIGIKTMRNGENARFIIKPAFAFREMGCPPRIPPNSTIIFDVHLVSYFSPDSILSFDEDNRDPNKFSKIMTEVKKLHTEGNKEFKLKNFVRAISKYDRVKELLHMAGCNSDAEEIEMMKHLDKVYTNLSICYLKQCAFNKVCRMCIEAMKYSERFSKHNVKLLFNWGKALRLLKDFKQAKVKLLQSLKLEPKNVEINNELQKLAKDREFNTNIELFTFQDDNSARPLPCEFWDMFDERLTEFIDSEDNIITIYLNENPDSIELAKRKASALNLRVHVVTKAGVETNCIAIEKIAE